MPTYSNIPENDRTLKRSLKDAGAFAVMTGIGETYLSAFALFLRASTPQIGLLSSLPPLLASLAQLFSAWLGHRTGHRKLIILTGATVQGLAWIPILFLPLLFPEHAVPLLIASVVVYQFGTNLTVPQWASLMGDLLPPRKRGRYFGVRTRVITALTFASLIAGGLILHAANTVGFTLGGFAALFAIACLARLVSVYHLGRMHDPTGRVADIDLPLDGERLRRLRRSNAARFSLFFALMQFAVAISAPFFTVFMLRELQFDYLMFTVNTGTAILVQFLTLSQWGRLGDIFGNRRILASTGAIIVVLPVLWLPSGNFWYLTLIQVFSGFAWAGFTLGASNFIYDLVSAERRAAYLAVHNVLASVAVFAGAMLGGYLGAVLPTDVTLFGREFSWFSPLCGVFVVSSLARLAVYVVLVPRLREVRPVRPISFRQLVFRVARVNALAGVVFEIVNSKTRSARARARP